MPQRHPRAPKIFNLRSDPFERAEHEAGGYDKWFVEHAFVFVPAQAIVGQRTREGGRVCVDGEALPPTAQIVYVQAASAHRAAAFAACEMIMDYLKTDAVFWKREDTGTGSRWVEATAEDRSRVSGWSVNVS